MTKDPVLLPEESVICGCKQEKGDVLLTSDGWLAEEVPARFEGLTRLHRLLHLSKVESLHPLEVKKQNDIARLALMASLVITSVLLGYDIVQEPEIWWEGEDTHICDDGQEIPYDLWSDGDINCADGSDTKGVWIGIFIVFNPIILVVILSIIRIRIWEVKILPIAHRDGTMKLKEINSDLDLLWKLYWGTLVLSILLFVPNGINDLIDKWGLYLAFGLPLVFLYFQFQQNPEKDGSTEEISYVSLEEFHEKLSTALGLSEEGSVDQEIRALSDSMGGELAIIRKRLEEHEDILTQIVVHYDHIYSGSTHWMGTSAVRASTEILLAHRLREILPNPSKEPRTLANYRDQLKRHDSGMEGEVLRSIDVIVSLGNAAAHNMEATKQDYLSALQKFADVVEWHLSTPAKNVSGI